MNSVSRAQPRLYSVPLPAVLALRGDSADKPALAAAGRDAEWFVITSLLEHAALHAGEASAAALDRAIHLCHAALGADVVETLGVDEWGTAERGTGDVVLLLADQMEQAGMLRLAGVALDSFVCVSPALTVVQQGRCAAQRARVASKQGDLDEAQDRYLRVQRLGRAAASDELKARAAIGLAVLAQLRGNYPDLRRLSARALRHAERTDIRSLLRYAHAGLMIAAAISHDFEQALEHGWDMYEASVGDSRRETEVLQNLGQALLDAGRPALARAAFSVVVSRELEARFMLPALGGLAMASALTGRRDLVDWTAEHVRRATARSVPRYALASALLECAVALSCAGDAATAEEFRARALDLGEAHGFNEVTIRAEQLLKTSSLTRDEAALGGRAAEAARALAWMEPRQLPDSIRISMAV